MGLLDWLSRKSLERLERQERAFRAKYMDVWSRSPGHPRLAEMRRFHQKLRAHLGRRGRSVPPLPGAGRMDA